jgi:glycosyltransferase involved in cell wall biosynthesis/Tfp pilus assembly protein PilF
MGIVHLGPPIELLSKLKEVCCIATFIETGTYLGDTAYWASEVFDHVITIEAAENLYKKVIERYRHIKNIEFIYGHSREKLGDVVAGLNGAAIFWLDAHWSGGPTYGESEQCPLIDEIKIINSSEHEHFIFIDDARLFMSPPPEPHPIEQWPDIRTVISTLSSSNKARYIMIFEDVIIAVPSLAKDSVARYCQNKNTKAWKEHGIVPDDRKQTADNESFKKLEKQKSLISVSPKRIPMVQRQSTRLLRKRISQIESCTALKNSQAEPQWTEYSNSIRQMILHDDPCNFLNWDPIVKTMFHEAKIEELHFLQSLPDWSRWQKALRESPVGNPKQYKAYPESSGNLIHHAYSLAQLEQNTECRIDQLTQIVEFGGGYGSMCRLAYQIGFNGRYIIYDLPELSALQEYFLNCVGLGQLISYNNTSDVSRSIVLLSDLDKLTEQLNYKVTGCAFIASWSLSEAPVEIRDRVFNLVSGADYYLIAYQDRFGRLDNSSYFAHLTRSRTNIAWTEYPIAHLPGNHYLIGSKKSLHITNPSKAVFDTPKSSGSIGGLIFSKDRSLQLRATIESFLLHCSDHDNIYLTVLYKASSELHAGQYAELKSKFPGINFVEESSFREQVLSVLQKCDYILLLVDDNIFIRHFCISDITAALYRETDAIGFSLRLGENTTYCYMAGTIQKQPRFERITDSILKYDWTVAEHDYNYPLEVSSSIYRSNEIVDFLSDGDFSNPNTLEIQMVSAEQFKQTRPKLLCYHTSVVFCNPANKVQNVCEQNRSGMNENYCSESLAQIYQQGMVIDVGKYAGFVSNGVHQEVKLYFRKAAKDAIKISVIMPCYNQARFLPEAIESLVNQTYKNWECIIVNDGSNDNTAEVAKQLIEKYSDRDIRFIDKPHTGVSDTRNVGIKAATSEWILPLDSDDMFEQTFMQRAVDIIQQEEKVDIVFANLQEFGAANGKWIPAKYSRLQVMLEDTMPYSSLYRKELWRRVGGYDKLLSVIKQPEDWSFWISCSKYNPIVKRITEKLFLYRVHPHGTYIRMIKPYRKLSHALVVTCHPDLYPVTSLVLAWQLIANCPDDVYERILEATEKYPEYGLAYFWRGLRQRRIGQVREVLEDYRVAAERAKEEDWQASFALMMLQKSQGDLAGARSSLEKLLSIRPDFDWARDMLSPRVVQQKILFYYHRIGNISETSPAGTVMAVLNFAKMLSNNSDMEIHITGNLVCSPEQYESLQIIPLPQLDKRAEFLAYYDVVFFATHVHYFKDLAKPPGQIWILWQHCWEADDLASLSHMSDFDIVVCLSELHRASLHNRSIGDEKLMIIPNLIDANVYSPKAVSRNNHSIMYAGALHPHKCVHILMDAFRIVRRQISDAELHIYGDGSMWRGGNAYGDKLKSTKPEGTYFHGYVNNKDMPEIYSKHSILCLSSKFESFGLVIVEAQACGCIPVVHNAGGAAVTLVDGQTGLLYSPNTPEKLAETIIAGFRMVDSDPSIRHRAVDFIRENFSTNRAPEYISRLWDRINIAREVNTIRTLLENNDAELADLKCEKLLQKYPNHPDAMLLQALIMNQQGNELKANAQIGELLEKFPNYVRALNDCGLMAMKAGDTKNAISFFTKAYKFNPWDKNTITNCYTVLKTSGNYGQAKILLLNYLTNIGVDAQMLYLLGEIDAFNTNAGSAVNLVSQQLVNNKQSVYCQDSTSKPLVSIIMPVYNGADYIGQAIESVLIQNCRNFELIIVNDGSTDRTEEIIKSFKDERIRYFLKENSGPSAARNLGIRHARGEFIVTFDSDDMVTPDFIARHLQEFQEHPEADLVYCDDCLIDENDKPIRIINRPEYKDRKLLIRDLFRAGFPVVPFRTTCIRKSVFDKIGLFDERLLVAEDYDMVRRFVKNGLNMHHFAEPIYLRRMTPNSLSRKSTAEKAKIHFDVVKRFTDTFTYDELFPDVAWDKIPAGQRQLHARCLAAVTFLAIGQTYVETNSPVCAETAFDQACSDMRDCLELEPDNRLFQQLLHKFELLRAESAPAMQQVAK